MNIFFLQVFIKLYSQAIFQAHSLHLGRIVTWVGEGINVVKSQTRPIFIEDFLFKDIKRDDKPKSVTLLEKKTWTLEQTSPVSLLFLVKLQWLSTFCSEGSSAELVMAHRVTAGYTTDSMGIWATEVEMGVSAQSLRKLFYFHIQKRNNKYICSFKLWAHQSRCYLKCF